MSQWNQAETTRESVIRRMNGDDRRKQILRVAQHVFAEHNYHGATTAKIAKAAGVTEPTIYLHFPSKKDLFIAVTEDCSRFEIESVKRAVEKTGDVLQAYRLIFEQLHEFTSKVNPDPAKILIINKVVDDPEIREVVRRCNDELYSLVTEHLRNAMDEGNIRDDVSPEVMAQVLVSLIREMISMLIIGSDEEYNRRFREGGEFLATLMRPAQNGRGRRSVTGRASRSS